MVVLFQELHVHIMSERPTSEVELEENTDNNFTINAQSCVTRHLHQQSNTPSKPVGQSSNIYSFNSQSFIDEQVQHILKFQSMADNII